MRVFSLLSTGFFLTSFSSVTHALSVSNLTVTPRYQCTPSEFGATTRNGRPSSCAKAMLAAFHTDLNLGVFHRGGPPDPYRLPIESTVERDCTVTLDLTRRSQSVEARWIEIWPIAQTLSTACTYYRNSDPSSVVTGGMVELFGGDMVLKMFRPGSPIADTGDASNVATA